jgi:hypothetical protein
MKQALEDFKAGLIDEETMRKKADRDAKRASAYEGGESDYEGGDDKKAGD